MFALKISVFIIKIIHYNKGLKLTPANTTNAGVKISLAGCAVKSLAILVGYFSSIMFTH